MKVQTAIQQSLQRLQLVKPRPPATMAWIGAGRRLLKSLTRHNQDPPDPSLESANRQPLTVGELAAEYLNYLRDCRGYAETTLRSYRSDFGQFCSFCQRSGRRQLQQIRRTDIERFIQSRSSKSVTKARKFNSLAGMFDYAVNHGYIQHTPIDRDDCPRAPKSSRDPIPNKDLDKLLQVAKPADEAAMLALLIYAGLRASELCSLQMADLHLDEPGETYITVQGKGNERREVPVCLPLYQALNDYLAEAQLEQCSPLFPKPNGQPMTYKMLRHRFEKWCHQAGLSDKGYVLHQTRHSFATQLVRHTDMRTAQQIMGHANINTTAGYAHSDMDRKQAAVAAAAGGYQLGAQAAA